MQPEAIDREGAGDGVPGRRSFLTSLVAFAASPHLLSDTTGTSRIAGVFPLPAPFSQQTATLVEIYCAPGQQSRAHRHPGFVLGYVIEGELRFQIAGQPQQIIRTGETFWEPPGALHRVAESAYTDRPARFLAIVIADSGKPLVEPL